ncbi:histidinol-phosphate aminotransferase (imidazole acetol-phosphate transaminase) [Legionella moravica]|uniref:Histidinol-phosphate aminotransferase n=1 Tax=Legionella moravica TaxID=39962 RepID=A0A378JXB3_9GAMM|nr:histidinol-phosphate transaminase [Legionella moravica]KTD32083.1 histidinol-phosphate aminotransferase (imidazole acetol-phosphate transaminase) [Legionella moravica]STX63056.1 histidinol-phosphate aminotransferase [Legionella moravica]
MSILNLIRPELLNSQNYVPGGEQCTLRLHANELPWCPVNSSIAKSLNYYPDTRLQNQLQARLAARYQVDPDQIVLTRGSDDGIDLVTRLFLTAGQDAFMQFPPTFPMYAFYVRLQQAELIQCPLNHQDEFSLALEQIKNNWQSNCKIIMLCSPNNPTGNLIDLDLIAAACEYFANRSVIVVDEAYIEFARTKSAVSLLNRYENLVILRTLSKASGLAGLRLGSIIAQAHVIEAFNKIIAPYIIPGSTIELATQAFENTNWFPTVIERIRSSKQKLIDVLKNTPVIEKVYPSETNFVLVKSLFAKELTAWFAEHNIAVRDFPPSSLLHDHIRITVGDPEQNRLLIDSLSSFINNVSGLNYAKDLIY